MAAGLARTGCVAVCGFDSKPLFPLRCTLSNDTAAPVQYGAAVWLYATGMHFGPVASLQFS